MANSVSAWAVKPGEVCQTGPIPKNTIRNCAPGLNIDVPDLLGINNLDINNLDLQGLSIDLSASTTDILSSSGWGTISLKKFDSTVHANSFQWAIVGDSVVLSNPAVLETWILSFANDISEISVSIDNIEVSEAEGTNTFSAEAVLDQTAITGWAESWYVNSGGSNCGGVFPDPQLCF
jgi:hypothetical protein